MCLCELMCLIASLYVFVVRVLSFCLCHCAFVRMLCLLAYLFVFMSSCVQVYVCKYVKFRVFAYVCVFVLILWA